MTSRLEQLREFSNMYPGRDLWTHPYPTYVPDPRKKKGIGGVDWYQQVIGLPTPNGGHAAEGDDQEKRDRVFRETFGAPYGFERMVQRPESRAVPQQVSCCTKPSPHHPSKTKPRKVTERSFRGLRGHLQLEHGPALERLRVFEALEIADRYSALGIDAPHPGSVCKGHCEGTGIVPVFRSEGDKSTDPNRVYPADEADADLVQAWKLAEKEHPAKDGWHFVKCPDCSGTGKRS